MTATDTEAEEGTATGNGEPPKQLLSAADIRNREDTVYETFPVRAWGGAHVRIRSLKSTEQDNYEAGINTQKNGKAVTNLQQARAKLAVLCLVDEAGNQLFNQRDVATLASKNAAAINEIFKRCCKLSGILQTESDMEELVGNSETTPESDSN